MVLPQNWAEMAAKDLVAHLRARTMAGLPHIGVLGPKVFDTESKADEPADIEEDEYTLQSGTEDDDPNFPDWKFVPNKMAYQLTVLPPEKTSLTTEISFYIRIKEGCDGDVGSEVGDRPKEYVLTKEELLAAFRHYVVRISNSSALDEDPLVDVFVDDTQMKIQNGNLKISTNEGSQSVVITITDESDPFLIYREGKPDLSKQKYIVKIKKDLTLDDDKLRVNLEVRNQSPRTQRSVIPERGMDKNTGKLDSEEECLKKLRDAFENHPLWSSYKPVFFKIPKLKKNPEGNRYGYLMEFEASETLRSMEFPYKEPDAARTVNAVMDDSELEKLSKEFRGKVTFRDHATFQEEVPIMAPGSTPDELFSELQLDNDLKLVLKDDLKFEHFYKFQDISLRKLIAGIRGSGKRVTALLSARTAGGKTEAFLIPIAQFCLENDAKGVKALVFYPTKALANDQTNRYIEMLYHLNNRIGSRRRKITLGLLHGDVSKFEPEPGTEDEWDLPLACPKCRMGTLKTDDRVLKCNNCNEVVDFVKVSNRQEIYSDPPDILITNPDTLIWDLMLRPQNHSILGRAVYVCKDCGYTYAPKGTKRKCENDQCLSTNLELMHTTVPSIVVFDEVHMFKGTFGINCSYFISRLKKILRKYNEQYLGQKDPKIISVGSTATISNPRKFAQDFFNCKPEDVILVPKDDDERDSLYENGDKDEEVRRHHVYIMPYAYSGESTIGRAIHYLQMRAKLGTPPTRLVGQQDSWEEFLQTICFVNSIRSSNNLIGLTRRTVAEDVPGLRVDGHTTDFDKKQRGKIERAFNRQELHVIFATATLEVGIDFRRVDVVMVNGFPFSFNDYLQRIGRGGRKEDCLVVTICQNWKPIDHFYYSNAKEALKKPAMHIEPVPITRHNVEALKKHARGAVLDFLISREDANEYVEDFRKFVGISKFFNDIVQHCIDAFEPNDAFRADMERAIKEFLDFLDNMARNELSSKSLFAKFREIINERYQLTSLRSTDREVLVEVVWTK